MTRSLRAQIADLEVRNQELSARLEDHEADLAQRRVITEWRRRTEAQLKARAEEKRWRARA